MRRGFGTKPDTLAQIKEKVIQRMLTRKASKQDQNSGHRPIIHSAVMNTDADELFTHQGCEDSIRLSALNRKLKERLMQLNADKEGVQLAMQALADVSDGIETEREGAENRQAVREISTAREGELLELPSQTSLQTKELLELPSPNSPQTGASTRTANSKKMTRNLSDEDLLRGLYSPCTSIKTLAKEVVCVCIYMYVSSSMRFTVCEYCTVVRSLLGHRTPFIFITKSSENSHA